MSHIEKRLTEYDEQIVELGNQIKLLLDSDLPPKKRRIGF